MILEAEVMDESISELSAPLADIVHCCRATGWLAHPCDILVWFHSWVSTVKSSYNSPGVLAVPLDVRPSWHMNSD